MSRSSTSARRRARQVRAPKRAKSRSPSADDSTVIADEWPLSGDSSPVVDEGAVEERLHGCHGRRSRRTRAGRRDTRRRCRPTLRRSRSPWSTRTSDANTDDGAVDADDEEDSAQDGLLEADYGVPFPLHGGIHRRRRRRSHSSVATHRRYVGRSRRLAGAHEQRGSVPSPLTPPNREPGFSATLLRLSWSERR